MHRYSLFLVALLALSSPIAYAAETPTGYATEYLWPEGAVPGAVGSEEADRPSLLVYLPPADKANGTGVVVIPGGGYRGLAIDHEGHDVARWLNAHGVAAFVLKYRLGTRYGHPSPLTDAQRAVRTVRASADKWHVQKDKVGIMGFSAGGHLASTLATHFDAGQTNGDAIDRESCRPDFAVLCYPVISMRETFTHAGSKRHLLGENPDPALVDLLSNETQVTAQTPPTFIFQTTADFVVPAENAVAFYLALRKASVPAELHIYERGKHGVGLAQSEPTLSNWPERLLTWLSLRGYAEAP